MEEIKAKLHAYDEQIDQLSRANDTLGREVERLTMQVEEEKVNKVEDEKFRKLGQTNAALKAKLEFIQSKYDFTSNVKGLSTDDFKQLMASNDVVSLILVTSVGEWHSEGLCGQVGLSEAGGVQDYDAVRYSFNALI